jgi:hypothetical protein
MATYPELLEKSYFVRELLQSVAVQIQDLEASPEIGETAAAAQRYEFVVLKRLID